MEQIWSAEFLFFLYFCVCSFLQPHLRNKNFSKHYDRKVVIYWPLLYRQLFWKAEGGTFGWDGLSSKFSEWGPRRVCWSKIFPKFNSAYKSRPQTVSGYFLSRRMDRKLGKQHWPMKLLFKAWQFNPTGAKLSKKLFHFLIFNQLFLKSGTIKKSLNEEKNRLASNVSNKIVSKVRSSLRFSFSLPSKMVSIRS